MKLNTREAICIVVAALLLVFAGCDAQSTIPRSDYGRLVGRSGGQSLNSTSVFGELLRSRGHRVQRQNKLSPRLERFDTIFWIPNRHDPPKAEAIRWLEDWLDEGDRTVIYVGRGYQADSDYWSDVVSRTQGEDQEKARRERLEHSMGSSWDRSIFWRLNKGEDDVAFWYQKKRAAYQDSSVLSGPWAEDVNDEALRLETAVMLQPPAKLNDSNFMEEQQLPTYGFRGRRLRTEELLTVNGETFAFKIESKQFNSKVVVISNASFLLNYSLLDKENRKLAMQVAKSCRGDCAFLETGPGVPMISDGSDDHSAWKWIAQKPMSYIVPHLLLWGVLFCFVYYPIFGKPRRINFSPPKKFRNHIDAVGEMLRKSSSRAWAVDKIKEFQKRAGRKKS